MEPIFARLDVRHESRILANGGMGTLQNALAAGSIYGPDVDILMCDSAMTENKGPWRWFICTDGGSSQQNNDDGDDDNTPGNKSDDKQQYKVPVLLKLSVLKELYIHADADVGGNFDGDVGIVEGKELHALIDVAACRTIFEMPP